MIFQELRENDLDLFDCLKVFDDICNMTPWL